MFVTLCVCGALAIVVWQMRRHVHTYRTKSGPWIMKPPGDDDARQ